jgi:hypothetical protein
MKITSLFEGKLMIDKDKKNNDENKFRTSMAKMLGKIGGSSASKHEKAQIANKTPEQTLSGFSPRGTFSQSQTKIEQEKPVFTSDEAHELMALGESVSATLPKIENAVKQVAERNSGYQSHKIAITHFSEQFGEVMNQLTAGQGRTARPKS